LGGTVGAAYAMISPAQTEMTANAADSHMPRNGRAVSRCAAPAGAASSPSSNSAPTAQGAAAALAPTRPRDNAPSRLTGTRRAAATASSMVANSSGLAIATSATQTPNAMTESVIACPADKPNIVPNKTLTPDVPSAPLAEVV